MAFVSHSFSLMLAHQADLEKELTLWKKVAEGFKRRERDLDGELATAKRNADHERKRGDEVPKRSQNIVWVEC